MENGQASKVMQVEKKDYEREGLKEMVKGEESKKDMEVEKKDYGRGVERNGEGGGK